MFIFHCFALLLTVVPVSGSPQPRFNEATAKKAKGCQALSKVLPKQVYSSDTPEYETESTAYWSDAAKLQPYCVFKPEDANSLAKGVKELAKTNTTFAIRGGGHAPVTGIAGTDHGVLIATSNFRKIEIVSSKREFGSAHVKVGAGLRWGEIYDFLNPYGLVVLGGRVWQVGTGSILGAGMTFLSQQHGWMSNNVLNFELVTSAGDILQVNQKTHPDLFWVLKAGGNNFGIVTRFDLKSYPIGPIFALNKLFLGNSTNEFFDAMTHWQLPGGGHEDVKGGIMPSTRYTPSANTIDAAITACYDANINNPLAFENFTKITGAIDIGTGIQNFSQLIDTTRTQFGTGSFRWNWYSTSIKFSNKTMSIIVDTMVETAKELLPNLSGFVGVAEEPISSEYATAARKNGGDPYDLDPKAMDGGFIVADFYVAYNFTSEDAAVENYLTTLIERVEAKTKKEGLYFPFYWLNTSGIRQNPFSTTMRAFSKLKAASAKYDPEGVFQKLVPGFKLGLSLT